MEAKQVRSFEISKMLVWRAWKRVKANRGAPGIDAQSISAYERQLTSNLYKLWNRMSSGSYFPDPVRRVWIPKADGKERPLGIPTVEDRVAQMVVKLVLEPQLDPLFHQDSYGYRPHKSAQQAVRQCRQRCWRQAWVVDLDIKGFFDAIDHELLMKALTHHVNDAWVILYVERWLKAAVCHPDGVLERRDSGVPQGGVISPLLSNLFLHYVCDRWLQSHFPDAPFERYADDAVVHCRSEARANEVLFRLRQRFEECGLELHPKKTRIVYCRDEQRRLSYPHTSFDFLGFSFQARRVLNRRGWFFSGFHPAVSRKSLKRMGDVIRAWRFQRLSELSLDDLARWLNPVIGGWINYYGEFYPGVLKRFLWRLDHRIIKWARKKYRSIRGSNKRSAKWFADLRANHPTLFAHWAFVYG
ncbi:group II intron reverse transcriptase/maturase [Algiphilus sp.]|uniref:group II intron reverse transcriptase/maturase n=1 Tax=Algiphilus sp. TaxID=1872431 RepID=UPI0032F046D9